MPARSISANYILVLNALELGEWANLSGAMDEGLRARREDKLRYQLLELDSSSRVCCATLRNPSRSRLYNLDSPNRFLHQLRLPLSRVLVCTPVPRYRPLPLPDQL